MVVDFFQMNWMITVTVSCWLLACTPCRRSVGIWLTLVHSQKAWRPSSVTGSVPFAGGRLEVAGRRELAYGGPAATTRCRVLTTTKCHLQWSDVSQYTCMIDHLEHSSSTRRTSDSAFHLQCHFLPFLPFRSPIASTRSFLIPPSSSFRSSNNPIRKRGERRNLSLPVSAEPSCQARFDAF